MKCTNCGEENLSGNECLNCGFETNDFQASDNQIQNYNNIYNQNNAQNFYIDDKKSVSASLIAFFIPVVGVILYFLNRRIKPMLAKSFKTGVLVNLILVLVSNGFLIFFIVFLFILQVIIS